MEKVLSLLLLCSSFLLQVEGQVGSNCTSDSSICSTIPNNECRDDGPGPECLCKSGYKASGDNSACIPNTVGDNCTVTEDCQFIANSECISDTCSCRAGHTASAENSTCAVVEIGDTCNYGGTDCSSIANSECRDDSSGYQCLCRTGYNGMAGTTICSIQNCSQPTPQVGYTFGTISFTTYESIVTVSCATGYEEIPDSSTIICQADGFWSTPTGCNKTDCGQPTRQEGYDLETISATTYKSTVTVSCATGYEGSPNSSTIKCQADKLWTTLTDCSMPQTTGYNYTDGTGTTYNETYSTECAIGYTGTASPGTVTCNSDGNWTTVSGCSIVNCSTPKATGYSYTDGTDTTYNETYTTECAIGYTGTASPATVTCQADGNWTTVSGCSIINCSTPQATGYNYTGGTSTTYNETYSTECAIGYTGTASPDTVTCQIDGNWTTVSGCSIVNCSMPQTTGYDYTGGTGTTYNETYSTECAIGYTGTASPETVTCKPDGNWTTVYGCSIVNCSTPRTTGYNYTGGTDTTYNETYSTECAIGYTGTASPGTVTCQTDGNWTTVSGCSIVNCSTPETTGYNYTGGTDTTYNESYSTECAIGYTGTAIPGTVTCQVDGNWTTVSGCRIVNCSTPQTTGYSYTVGTGTTYQETYSTECATGYTGTASPGTVACETDGNWTSVSGCSIVDCSAPQTTGYSYTVGTGTTYQETYSTECATGYTGTASPGTVACETDGNWTSVSGCSIVDCSTPQTTGFNYTGGSSTTYNETYTAECAMGYTGTASPGTVHCQADGNWTTVSGCSIVNCSTPQTTGYSYSGGTGTTYNETYNTECAIGYTGTASPGTVLCQVDGNWTTVSGCSIVYCQDPDPITGLIFGSVTTKTYLSVVTTTCDTGYEGTGIPIVCLSSGLWSTNTGCKLVDCIQSGTIETGYTVSGSTVYGGTPTVECVSGYAGTPGTTTCQANGSWSGFTGCVRDCGTPSQAGYTFANATATTFQSQVDVLACSGGYTGAPTTPQVTCQNHGLWSTTAGCSPVNCGEPLTTGYVYGEYTATNYQSTVPVSACAVGYVGTVTTPQITCLSIGNWSIPQGCTIVDCLEPVEPANGKLDLSAGTQYGATAKQSCIEGYLVSGTQVIECLASGSWSAGPVTCTIKATHQALHVALEALQISFSELEDAATKKIRMFQVQNVIQQLLRNKTGILTLVFVVTDLRRGSLIIEGDIILPKNTSSTNKYLNASSRMVFNEEPVEIDGQVGTFQSITIDGQTYTKANTEEYLCKARELLEGPCESGKECVATSNSETGYAECRLTAKKDNFGVIIGVGVGVPLFLLAVMVCVLAVIYVRRQRRRSEKYESESESDDQPKFTRQIATRYPGRNSATDGFDSSYHVDYGHGDKSRGFGYPWDSAYHYTDQGRKFHIQRPKY